jgi:predicted nucleic acid-binding protein
VWLGILLDDRAARNCASALKIPVRGTLGVLLLAKKNGKIAQRIVYKKGFKP